MRRRRFLPVCLAVAAGMGALVLGFGAAAPATKWSVNATIIEACSCPMFCQCYFATKPAEHHDHGGAGGHFCKFNNAFKINKGSYGATRLDGARFWVAGDLGDEFSDAQMDWAVLTFDPAVTPEQRKAITTMLGALYPVTWKSFTTAKDAPIEWTANKDSAHARLDGGKAAEVSLKRNQGMTNDPIVIKNLKYWGAPRNDGFVLMQNEVEAYRVGDKTFEFKGTNGFMITFDISSQDAAPKPSSGMGGN